MVVCRKKKKDEGKEESSPKSANKLEAESGTPTPPEDSKNAEFTFFPRSGGAETGSLGSLSH